MGAAPDPPPDSLLTAQDGATPPEGRQGPQQQPTSGGGGGGGHRRPTLPSLPGFLAGARASGPPVPVEPPEPPDEFIDPISQELLIDPVLLVETGQSYERSNLELWFKRCQEAGRPCTDPLTRQVLRHTTVVPNFSLKSLVTSWAERHRISDLSTFSKGMGKQRTMARVHSPGSPAALAADALAELNLGPGAVPHSAGQSDGGAGKAAYPALAGARLGAGDSAGPELAGVAPLLQRRQASVPPRPSSPQELYPTMRPGTAPPGSRRQAAEAALAALRAAAAPGGGSASAGRGAAPYHAWSLMQLAGDGEGRRILWEENAIPLAIYMLGHNYTQQQQQQRPQAEEDPLDAAKPALCALLQRLAARDRDVAASIAQCGGVQALVGQLTAADPARRAAGCFALYFLGWQGSAIRSAIYEALAEHAAACRLPPRALMAFWRFWEQQQQQQPAEAAGQAGSRPGSPTASSQAGGGCHADLAEGREAQWEPLALLLHMLAEGTVSGGGTPTAATQHMLQQLDAAGTAIPAVLAHGAVASADPAVNFAAARATHLLAQLPQNLPLLLPALLQAGQAAVADAADAALGEHASMTHPGYAVIGGSETPGGKAAGNAAALMWELSYSPASGGTYPPAVQLVQQGGHWLLPALEAALDPAQGRQAACRRVAAGLLACLLYEPPHQQPGTPAAAAADGMRRLLAQPAAAQVLQRLLALLQPDVAAAHPQAARAAALAVANMAAYRGAAPAAAAQIPEATPAGMRAKLAGLTNRLKKATPGSLGSGDYSQALNSAGSSTDGASSFDREQPTEPRAALQYFGAVHLLLRLVPHCSAAAAAAKATAASAARAPAAPMLAQPTDLVSPTAAQQAAAAASAAAESAAEQSAVLVAVLQALNNLCVDPAVAGRLQKWARPTVEAHQQLTAALMAAMADPSLPPASREQARLLLHTESGAPGQRHALACTLLAPPPRSAAYPNP